MKIRVNAINNLYEFNYFENLQVGALFIKSINDADIYLKVSISEAYSISKKQLYEFGKKLDVLFISNLTDNDFILRGENYEYMGTRN